MRKKTPARKYFYSSIKDGKIGDDGKISDGHISVKDFCNVLKILWVDPCHYFSSFGLRWDAMLKMTGVKLEKNIRH